MKKTTTRILALAAVSVGLILAQGRGTWPNNGNGNGNGGTPPDPATMLQNRIQFLTTMLSLTDSQVQQATQIFTDEMNAEQPIQTSLKTDRQSLDTAVKANDQTTIDKVSADIGTLTGQLTALHAKAEAAFWAILTSDQQAKYDTLHGPGGPGGGPGPNFRGAPRH